MKEENLKSKTDTYFCEGRKTDKYIKELLPEELKYIKERNKKLSSAEILVQLVGFSWEPLLISVCIYKPEKIYIILNKYYGEIEGNAKGDDYKENINKLKEQNLIDNVPDILPDAWETVEDTPKDVFDFLKKHILSHLNDGKQVVIDITGAKKSMVSGAYLFASYTNCPVSYIDFDRYSEKYSIPYGYTCKINEFKNPMEVFKLREWERVEQLYRQYSFRTAKSLILEIKQSTKSFMKDDGITAINRLIECLKFYEAWDEGDYKGALERYKDLQKIVPEITCPTAVEKLGEFWPDRENLKEDIKKLEEMNENNHSIYKKKNEIIVYAEDELEKIKRIVKYQEDYRSALLRAAGLSDFLLKVRIIKLWNDNQFVVEMNGKSYSREDLEKEKKLNIKKALLEFAGASYIIKCLRYTEYKQDYVIELNIKGIGRIKAHRLGKAIMLDKFWENIKADGINLPDDIFIMRNKAIHFCLSIPEKMSRISVKFTEENLKEYNKNWTEVSNIAGIYKAMDWQSLCDVCKINFLPKIRRVTDG
ncbi:hypothetical protein DRQ09_04300 [candidate division KSB1 bacterium]|nr:MAG: hypothetical protein DRQ09_04300 [candidate division KSB1 bacterium]